MSTAVPDRLSALLSGRYVVERGLGEGGMATVFLAQDLKHRRRVAIKVLKPDVAASLATDRFLREIEIAANLSHPHIIPLFDSGGEGDLLYYVMPFVEGESLRALLDRQGTLALDQALRFTREIASALAGGDCHEPARFFAPLANPNPDETPPPRRQADAWNDSCSFHGIGQRRESAHLAPRVQAEREPCLNIATALSG